MYFLLLGRNNKQVLTLHRSYITIYALDSHRAPALIQVRYFNIYIY